MPNFSPKLQEATDEQLKNWIDEINPQYAPLASEELTRRRFEEFNKSTSYFSKILGLFAVIQIIIAIMQFTLSVQSEYDIFLEKITVIVIFFLAITMILFVFYKILKK
jgi:hypothetical protein